MPSPRVAAAIDALVRPLRELPSRLHEAFADHMLVKVPDGVDPLAIASIADNIPDGWRAVAPQLKAWPGARVLVLGGGAQSIGLYAVGLAVSLGAGEVLYLDDDATRRAVALRVGARAEPLALADRDGAEKFEITVDASGNPDVLRFAFASTAANGTLGELTGAFAGRRQGATPRARPTPSADRESAGGGFSCPSPRRSRCTARAGSAARRARRHRPSASRSHPG